MRGVKSYYYLFWIVVVLALSSFVIPQTLAAAELRHQRNTENMSSSSSSSIKRATSILNGVVGDYLEASNNELALEMGFYRNDTLLDPSTLLASSSSGEEKSDETDDAQKSTRCSSSLKMKKICILIHGLTDDESTWEMESNETYGSLLQRDFDVYPLYLRYNTGLHISTNGHKLNSIMKALLASFSPDEPCQFMFLCHSMGGLVTRSALHYGYTEGAAWIQKVTRVVFLGTPHQGSHWERLGNVVSNALGSVPRPYMKLAETTANLRSAGIKDLRYGYILDEDWQNEDDDDDEDTDEITSNDRDSTTRRSSSFLNKNTKKRAHLVESIAYYVVTGTVTKNPRHPIALCIGDALVQKASAEGRSDNEDHHLDFPAENFCEFAGVSHGQLPRNPAVYEQIKTWFEMPFSPQQPEPSSAGEETAEEDKSSTHQNVDDGDGAHDEFTTTTQPKSPPGTWAKRKGVASIFQDAIGNGVAAVHDVHMALANETFDILGRFTPSCIVSRRAGKRIKTMHDTTVGGVYGIIRGVSDGVTEIAKLACDEMSEREQASED